MFDFYADAYNFESLRGSNATSALLAYTATFGGGFSATIGVEDGVSRRDAIFSTVPAGAIDPVAFGGYTAFQAGQQIPDIVGNLRVDQPWGSAQISGAAHQLRTSLYLATASAVPASAAAQTTYAFPQQTQNDFGFAVQGGLKLNVPQTGAGDTFYLQGTYEQGAIGYITGNNLAFTGGFWASSFNYGNGVAATSSSNGYVSSQFADCVYVVGGGCQKQSGFAVVSAFKHFWSPTWSSAIFGSYMSVKYSGASNNPVLGTTLGVPNYREYRIGTNLIWTPVKGFDIGAEFMYQRGLTDKPAGFTNDYLLAVAGLPRFQSTSNVYEGRLRVQRAF
jgi:hypothetical protein